MPLSPFSALSANEAAKRSLRKTIRYVIDQAEQDGLSTDIITLTLETAASRAFRDITADLWRFRAFAVDVMERMLAGEVTTPDEIERFVGDHSLNTLPPRQK